MTHDNKAPRTLYNALSYYGFFNFANKL